MKSYRATWNSRLLLACGKCQRKLRRGPDVDGLGKLKKALKKRGGRSDKFLVINTPCLDVCPKRGIVVCTTAQVGKGMFSILRSSADLDALIVSSQTVDTPK